MGRLARPLSPPWHSGDTSLNSPTIAVIIPTFNEETSLSFTLESLRKQTRLPDRVFISDAASTDSTRSVAEREGAAVFSAPHAGRGNQIAAAVERVNEQIVLVAHADMLFPAQAIERVIHWATSSPASPGGCLGHCFDTASRGLKWVEWADRRRALRGISYGDQAQFFRREIIETLGGFPSQPLMEDVELARLLKRAGQPVYLDCPVTVSARKFAEQGFFQTCWKNFLLRRTYSLFGRNSCEMLYRHYYRS